MVLVLEQLISKAATLTIAAANATGAGSSGNINCTAKFMPVSDFDASNFQPMSRDAIFGCLGMVLVESGRVYFTQ
jgi:hypothetical protein